MSNSFSPKNAPNVFNQETLERALVIMRQPFSIAVLASLGLHGLLWAVLPNILAETAKEADTKQRVQVVELSPAEQGQLPSSTSNPIPPTLLPTNPVKPAQSNTKLPEPKLNNDSSLYNFPLLQPPPPDVFPSFGLPPTTFDYNQPTVQKPPKPSPKPTTPPAPPTTPPTTNNSSKPPNPETPNTRTPSTAVDPKAPVLPEKQSPEKLAALLKDGERSRNLRALYTFNGPDTQEKASNAFNTNGLAFIEVAKKITGDNADDTHLYKTPERVGDLFPKEACPFVRGVRNASYGVIIKPDGTLAEPPTVLLPSGFTGLDNAAIDDISSIIKNKKIGENGRFRLVRFDYVFDPKVSCPNPSKPA